MFHNIHTSTLQRCRRRRIDTRFVHKSEVEYILPGTLGGDRCRRSSHASRPHHVSNTALSHVARPPAAHWRPTRRTGTRRFVIRVRVNDSCPDTLGAGSSGTCAACQLREQLRRYPGHTITPRHPRQGMPASTRFGSHGQASTSLTELRPSFDKLTTRAGFDKARLIRDLPGTCVVVAGRCET